MPDWRHRAACRDEDPELFFYKGREDSLQASAQIIKAKTVCRRCPVISDCLRYALKTGPEGVWGGTTFDERADIRRRLREFIDRHGREAAEDLSEVM